MSTNGTPRLASHLATRTSSPFNVTIDDEYGDQYTYQVPGYFPQDGWAQGATCYSCGINPKYIYTGDARNYTWHDSTYPGPGGEIREISIDFIGTAVYVYHIVVNHQPSPTGYVTLFTNLTFFIDNSSVGTYTHWPDPDSEQPILYSVPVYVNETLANEKHTLQIQSGGPTSTLVLFDYIEYTADSLPLGPAPDSPPSPLASYSYPDVRSLTLSSPSTFSQLLLPTSTPTLSPPKSVSRLSQGAIAAIATPIALTLIFSLLALLRYRARRARTRSTIDSDVISPYMKSEEATYHSSDHGNDSLCRREC